MRTVLFLIICLLAASQKKSIPRGSRSRPLQRLLRPRLPRPIPHYHRAFRFSLEGHGRICKSEDSAYDYTKPTHQVYSATGSNETAATGPFAKSRDQLDYSYHAVYQRRRRLLQDQIVLKILKDQGCASERIRNANPELLGSPRWLIFTAGAMGSGKGYTMRWLESNGYFPLNAFVYVDPDEIRTQLPEWTGYVEANAAKAARLTNRESGLITEILVQEALKRSHNVVIDGTLRDYEWYKIAISKFRKHYPDHKIAIVHVTAPLHIIRNRVRQRALLTGRLVPDEDIRKSYAQVPDSVDKLSPLVDFFARIINDEEGGEPKLIIPDCWEEFSAQWFSNISKKTESSAA
eukprot:CAMPEP_0114500416 /NCGR_PEP_ID=MMETSP0109-20121206/7950_1 /TAXON_ID=29199 /ORGANISM="Chlorarachnion reptans, Strain CCCM449" /LENGTH=347 /DNA_ID=CAMNT_0001678071 /DNA_START=260 /DNA_END=1303 /DNA_ORIENTATION=-